MSSAEPPSPNPTPVAAPGASRSRRQAGGFTLLEVLCALALLSGITGVIARMWFSAFEQGRDAVVLRDLREAADTVFRRLLYEDGLHADGLRTTLDSFYAEFAHIEDRARWEPYGMEYTRRPRVAAGKETADAEALFDGSERSNTASNRTGSDTTGASATDKADDQSLTLYKITLRIYLVSEPDKDLITLQTYLPSLQESKTAAGGASTPR